MVSWSQEWLNPTAAELDIYLKRRDGESWQEVDGSATGGGLSATFSADPSVWDGQSYGSSVALMADGGPAVAWMDEMSMSSGAAVYFRAHHNPPEAHGAMAQLAADGLTVIPVGGVTGSSAIVFRGAYPMASSGDGVRMDIGLPRRRARSPEPPRARRRREAPACRSRSRFRVSSKAAISGKRARLTHSVSAARGRRSAATPPVTWTSRST